MSNEYDREVFRRPLVDGGQPSRCSQPFVTSELSVARFLHPSQHASNPVVQARTAHIGIAQGLSGAAEGATTRESYSR